MIVVDKDKERKLVELLPVLHDQVQIDIEMGNITGECTFLADIRDYFMYLALDCKREEAEEIMERFYEYGQYFENEKHTFHFYDGFFFTLYQIISLRLEIKTLPIEEIGRDAFKESFEKTLKRLNL